MHRATIASRVGGVPVLIDDGVNGLIFQPGNERQLAEHLLTLAGDPELRHTFGERIYEKASREFSIDRMVEHQLEIYESILKRDARQKSRQGKRDGTIICGAYGHGNAGDDAILKSIIQSVQQLDDTMPITVLAKNTQSIKKRYRVNSIYTFNIPKMFSAMRKSQLYINGGGTLIQNATSWRSLWYYLFTLRLAKTLGNKVDMYGCGIGPVTGAKNIHLVKRGAGPFRGHHHFAGTGLHGGTGNLRRETAGDPAQFRPCAGAGPLLPGGRGCLLQAQRLGRGQAVHLLHAAHLVRL